MTSSPATDFTNALPLATDEDVIIDRVDLQQEQRVAAAAAAGVPSRHTL